MAKGYCWFLPYFANKEGFFLPTIMTCTLVEAQDLAYDVFVRAYDQLDCLRNPDHFVNGLLIPIYTIVVQHSNRTDIGNGL